MSHILSSILAFLVGVIIIGGGAFLIGLGVKVVFPDDESIWIVMAAVLGFPLVLVAFPAIVKTYEWAREWTP